jgi:hypothetical protein
VHILVPEKFRTVHVEHQHEFMAHPQARSVGAGRDLYGLRKNGSEFPVEIGLNPIETSGGIYVLSAIVDISERKRVEAERRKLITDLQQTQRLESLGVLAGASRTISVICWQAFSPMWGWLRWRSH